MIPKLIHYCWFGKNPKPESIQKCIESWKIHFPDYKIVEWNEKTFPIDTACTYVKQAYEAKKFAFVSDYVRLYALYEVGGLYFDTDIEAINNIDHYLKGKEALFGFEDNYYIMTGFMAAAPGLNCFKELIDLYNEKTFILSSGKYDTLPNPIIVTEVLMKYGLIPNGKRQTFANKIEVYPYDYFSGFNIDYQRLNITSNTCLIHHCMGTWQTPKEKIKPKIKSLLLKIIGEKNFYYLKENFYKKNRVK